MSANSKKTCAVWSDGFSLIEVLVAMTILTAGILGVMEAFSLCTQTASGGLRLAEATAIAQNQLELAACVPAESIEPQTGTSGPCTWQVTLAEKPHGLVLALVTVKWMQQGRPQTFQLWRAFDRSD